MSSDFPPPPASRVTLRDIAKAVGCSATTVSFALRSSPKVLPGTREKVLQIAEKLGYSPDPEISKLMAHLRQPSHHSFSHNLAFINSWPDQQEYLKGYVGEIFRGAKIRAAQLGFDIEPFWLQEKSMTAQRLSSVIYHRGIQGVLLPPWHHASEVVQLDWAHFSTIAITMSITQPSMNRVAPNVFQNTLLACEELFKKGYRRLGFVETEDFHARSEGMARGAFEMFCATRQSETSRTGVTLKDWKDPKLLDWFQKHRPDAIICPQSSPYKTILQALGKRLSLGVIVLDAMQDLRFTAIDQIPSNLGARAVEILVSQMMRNEKGIPEISKLVLLSGRLRPGTIPLRTVSSGVSKKSRAAKKK